MTKEELAEQITNEVTSNFQNLIKEVFLKGYELGELQAALTVRVDGVEYVDLGLPSGTLWSKTPLEDISTGYYAQFCHADAQKLNIPNEEQCKELIRNKKAIEKRNGVVENIGPSGQRITTYFFDPYLGEECSQFNKFWIKGVSDDLHLAPILTAYPSNSGLYNIGKHFAGYRLPVLLVKSKSEI